jgi:hypothetical protein
LACGFVAAIVAVACGVAFADAEVVVFAVVAVACGVVLADAVVVVFAGVCVDVLGVGLVVVDCVFGVGFGAITLLIAFPTELFFIASPTEPTAPDIPETSEPKKPFFSSFFFSCFI